MIHIHYTVEARTHTAAGHVLTAGVPLCHIIKPPVAPAADVEGSSQSWGWKAKAPAHGAECPWVQRSSYYLSLCLPCVLSSALQRPPQRRREIQGLLLNSVFNLRKEQSSLKKSGRLQRGCRHACVSVCDERYEYVCFRGCAASLLLILTKCAKFQRCG